MSSSASQGRYDELIFGGYVVERNLNTLQIEDDINEDWKDFFDRPGRSRRNMLRRLQGSETL